MPRHHATPIDYVIVAVNPALIMLLIGSLVYFLLEIFYQGQYPARLHYCLSWYVFGAVLVSRVSMEEGWERAAPLGIALAVVMILATHRFVSYAGTNLEAIGWLINYSMIGLISWCAHKLTWDCTLIDETQDASGEGLLQTAGLSATHSDDADPPSNPQQPHKKPDPKDKQADDQSIEISVDSPNNRAKKQDAARKSWWQQFVDRRRRPHAHGLWVVYFSLAALPMFGLGQAVIPVANAASRRYAFVLLCIYVACALALLMTTSFLGLRRYLRQRKLEMPAAMSGTWLATGTVLIVAILLFAALLPRPNAEYAISKLPSIGSTKRDASDWSVGREGTDEGKAEVGRGERRPDDQPQGEAASEASKSGEPSDSGEPSEDAAQQEQSGKSEPGSESSQRGEGEPPDSASRRDSQSKADDPPTDSTGDSDTEQQPSDSKRSQPSETESGDESSGAGESEGNDTASDDTATQPPSEPSQSPSSQPPPPPPSPDPSSLASTLAEPLKWLFYAIVIAAAIWWSWRNRERLAQWFRDLVAAWHRFWQGLFGGSRSESLPETIEPIHRHFSEFTDPFASGAAARSSPEELVRYSYAAFEAWARDRGWPRQEDQTAYEFARAVGRRAKYMAGSSRNLAELYGRVAYADGKAPKSAIEQLRELWIDMLSTPVGV